MKVDFPNFNEFKPSFEITYILINKNVLYFQRQLIYRIIWLSEEYTFIDNIKFTKIELINVN